MGKGSAPRPFSISEREYADNFDRIFGGPKKKLNEQKTEEQKKQEKEDEQND